MLPLELFEERLLGIGDSDGLRVLDTVYVVGYSDDQLPAETVVDAIGERYFTLRENLHPSGTSWRPVIDRYGEVVGMIRSGPPGRIQDQAILINRVREEMPAMWGSALP